MLVRLLAAGDTSAQTQTLHNLIGAAAEQELLRAQIAHAIVDVATSHTAGFIVDALTRAEQCPHTIPGDPFGFWTFGHRDRTFVVAPDLGPALRGWEEFEGFDPQSVDALCRAQLAEALSGADESSAPFMPIRYSDPRPLAGHELLAHSLATLAATTLEGAARALLTHYAGSLVDSPDKLWGIDLRSPSRALSKRLPAMRMSHLRGQEPWVLDRGVRAELARLSEQVVAAL